MKSLVHAIPKPASVLIYPLAPATLPLFFGLAFLPAILRLMSTGAPGANLLVFLAPAVAGFWFAATRRDHQVSFALTGAALTTLLWAVNWLMLAEGGCCSGY